LLVGNGFSGSASVMAESNPTWLQVCVRGVRRTKRPCWSSSARFRSAAEIYPRS